jgi:hypothetical protein
MQGYDIAIVHPDLGLGGAERLIVDAATALQRKGHRVTVFTSHHDKAHAFPETTTGSCVFSTVWPCCVQRVVPLRLRVCPHFRLKRKTRNLRYEQYAHA